MRYSTQFDANLIIQNQRMVFLWKTKRLICLFNCFLHLRSKSLACPLLRCVFMVTDFRKWLTPLFLYTFHHTIILQMSLNTFYIHVCILYSSLKYQNSTGYHRSPLFLEGFPTPLSRPLLHHRPQIYHTSSIPKRQTQVYTRFQHPKPKSKHSSSQCFPVSMTITLSLADWLTELTKKCLQNSASGTGQDLRIQ